MTAEETVTEVVEAAAEKVPVLMRAVVPAIAMSAGVAVGYLVAIRKLQGKYAQALEEEIEKTKNFYATLNKVSNDGTPVTPQDLVEDEPVVFDDARAQKLVGRILAADADEALAEYQGEGAEVAESATDNVFVNNADVDDLFDYEEEKALRTKTAPYIITHDEYFEAELDYDQSRLTYFQEESVLVTEEDQTIDDVEAMVGEKHLTMFGRWSKDPMIVFVRNPRLKMDFEIVTDDGSFLEAIGLSDEGGGS